MGRWHRWERPPWLGLGLLLLLRSCAGAVSPPAASAPPPPRPPPRFAEPSAAGVNPRQIWLPERSRLNLKCPLLEPQGPRVQWLRDGKQLLGETALFLDVRAVSRQDGGIYQCLAANDVGAALSWPMNVTVLCESAFSYSLGRCSTLSGFLCL